MNDELEMKSFYENYREVPKGSWPWKNFYPAEIACRGTGNLLVNRNAMDSLQALRDRLGVPMIINSGYRSQQHNRAVGGAKHSKHLSGVAFDIRMDNHDPDNFERAARECGFLGFGYYPKQGFMHIDLGPARHWGAPFSRKSPTRFAPEPVPKPLTQSKTMAGAGVAGVATALQALATGLVSSADETLPKAKQAAELTGSVIPSWTPYVFAAVALAGVVLVAYARWKDQDKIGVPRDD